MCYFKIIINICKTSLTLYFFISLNVLITQAKVRIIILLSKYFALIVLKVIPYFMYI